jgi:hypothetical protein
MAAAALIALAGLTLVLAGRDDSSPEDPVTLAQVADAFAAGNLGKVEYVGRRPIQDFALPQTAPAGIAALTRHRWDHLVGMITVGGGGDATLLLVFDSPASAVHAARLIADLSGNAAATETGEVVRKNIVGAYTYVPTASSHRVEALLRTVNTL